MPNTEKIHIDASLVHQLIATQFPQWADLPIKPVEFGGWDNRTFHLGEQMIVRLPSAAEYAQKVQKEQYWLLKLAPFLPLPIPVPLAMGKPAEGYPWHWSIYGWIDGETTSIGHITDLRQFAITLAEFLVALQAIDTTGGPVAGPHNFYRGGPLTIYDAETQQAIATLGNKIDSDVATAVWNEALATTWHGAPVWVHGDISTGNLLVQEGRLSAVIDFGGLAIGDPACYLAIAWTFFNGESRDAFRAALPLDNATWARGRGWALWKALIIAAETIDGPAIEKKQCWRTIDEILADHKRKA